ncbi:hypothetical protein LOAG_09366 [Loa loa]|uniref:Uncharacterized protein n=1 Tax=Loa loa TaxID=7209 RepID=A0A1S0TS09_LOALO|nr:hypothetical protein LOAG_09366 [Loa loa]EFO19128.1 hypothetical protein LOAG_09366 [Loa loa]
MTGDAFLSKKRNSGEDENGYTMAIEFGTCDIIAGRTPPFKIVCVPLISLSLNIAEETSTATPDCDSEMCKSAGFTLLSLGETELTEQRWHYSNKNNDNIGTHTPMKNTKNHA